MKPAPFDYHRPDTVEEAVDLLARVGDDSAVLAGGQSLVPLMNLRLARPSVLVDINEVHELNYTWLDGDVLRIGATTRASTVLKEELVRRSMPALTDAVSQIGHPQIRNRTTIGGNVCHADPAAELGVVLLSAEASVTLTSTGGQRDVSMADFVTGPFVTAKDQAELLTEVRIPLMPGLRWGFAEVARRPGDYATVACCVGVRVEDGCVREARIGLAGCAPTVTRVGVAEEAVVGLELRDAAVVAGREVMDAVEARGEAEESPNYRRYLAGRLTRQLFESIAGESDER